MKKIGIIALNRNTPQFTIDLVKSLIKITHPNFTYHIYIVDNGSTDDSVSQFKKELPSQSNISVHTNSTNLGYTEGNNVGIRQSLDDNCDYTLVINSDVYVKSDFLTILYEYLEAHQNCGLAAPKMYFASGHEFHKDRYATKDLGKVIWSAGGQIDWNNIYGTNVGIDDIDVGQYDEIKLNQDYLSGCCLLIRSQVLRQLGLFDNKYFLYLEDADFSQKLLRNNIDIAYIPKSVIWHINAGSSGGGPLHDYFLSRNRLLFGFRYASFRTKIALIKDSVKIYLFSPYVWQRYGIRDYYLGKLGKGSWK